MAGFLTLGDIEKLLQSGRPRRRFIIPGVLPAGPCLLFGASGSGKTGAAIRAAVAVASGLTWAGIKPQRGSVLYVAGEDFEGAQDRMLAAVLDLGLEPNDVPMAIVRPKETGMVSGECRMEVEVEAKRLAKQFDLATSLVIFDTLAACFGDGSQDDATAASRYMNQAEKLAQNLRCAVLSVHHTGKDQAKGMRGSQVFFDRADAVVKVQRGKGASSFVEVEKMRNGVGGARFAFDITGMDLAAAGETINVQVVRNLNALEPAETETREQAKMKREITDSASALAILEGMLVDGSASKEAWQEACYGHWSSKPSQQARKQAFSASLKKLSGSGRVLVHGDTVSVIVSVSTPDATSDASQPAPVSVSVSTPLSKRGERLRTDSPNSHLQGDGAEGSRSGTSQAGRKAKATAFDRGAGGEAPAEDLGAAPGADTDDPLYPAIKDMAKCLVWLEEKGVKSWAKRDAMRLRMAGELRLSHLIKFRREEAA